MAKTYTAPFAQAKDTGTAILTAANNNYTAPTAAVLLHAAGAEGGLVRRITAVPRATVTATQLQLYRSTDGGTTMHFVKAVVMSAYTMANTTAPSQTDFGISFAEPLSLEPNERLYVAAAVALAAGIAVTAETENF